ncbi:MAG: hypothetical protein COB67_04365 [SAR324 cluster bacterium]|uniref:HTH gntR-type domain-containing protein n=1 Tax=SAR324 cluster bacterium TaxID=2024889 RepID=A0A2A4T6N1_9DELT|nr:MAG: hypothetical protein COB67_04365 [SAR324 cluster bacterium]
MNKKRHEIILQLKELIASKMYSPGSKLPAERELASMLGVSRSLLREAIVTLEAWGYLELRERQGIFIVTPTIQDFKENMQFMPFWHDDLLPQVMEMRRILNIAAAGLAAQRRTEQDLAKLRECIERLESGPRNSEQEKKESADWEMVFHNLIIEAAHNTIMSRVNEGLYSIIERNQTLYSVLFMASEEWFENENWFDIIVTQHKSLLQAIEQKDIEKATLLMTQHHEDSSKKIETLEQKGAIQGTQD